MKLGAGRGVARALCVLSAGIVAVSLLSGCRFFSSGEPTRTPIPTFTPTPILVVLPAGAVAAEAQTQQAVPAAGDPQVAQVEPAVQAAPTSAPPTSTPAPTETPAPTPTPTSPPTLTPTPTVTPTPVLDFPFELESAQKFPTASLAPGVVRIYLYVYAPGQFGLADYGLRITHNGARRDSDSLSEGGLPRVTRQEPGPYSRFTNLSEIVVEAEAGKWIIQLVDADDQPVGPAAEFDLAAGENTRELYVRYRWEAD